MVTYGAIVLILIGNLFYAYRCIFQTREYIERYGFGEGSAIMTRLVGTFAAGFAIVLAIAMLTSIEGAWLFFVYGAIQAIIGAAVGYWTINSHWGSVEGVKTSAEGYLAPAIIAALNIVVLATGKDLLFVTQL
jgi:fatty-acid desaturase